MRDKSNLKKYPISLVSKGCHEGIFGIFAKFECYKLKLKYRDYIYWYKETVFPVKFVKEILKYQIPSKDQVTIFFSLHSPTMSGFKFNKKRA